MGGWSCPARSPIFSSARYGGEEFAAILTDADLDGAMRLAGRLRTAVEAAEFPHGLRITIGVALPQPLTRLGSPTSWRQPMDLSTRPRMPAGTASTLPLWVEPPRGAVERRHPAPAALAGADSQVLGTWRGAPVSTLEG